jgi:hypothetical protein
MRGGWHLHLVIRNNEQLRGARSTLQMQFKILSKKELAWESESAVLSLDSCDWILDHRTDENFMRTCVPYVIYIRHTCAYSSYIRIHVEEDASIMIYDHSETYR